MLKSSKSLKKLEPKSEKGHQRKIQTDNDGNKVEVVTDFCIHDYKHSCRTCKEMESITQTTKVLSRRYNARDILKPKK